MAASQSLASSGAGGACQPSSARLEKERLRSARPLAADDDVLDDPGETPLENLGRTEARERLAALLARLVPEQRAVLVLREIEQLSYREIAETLSIPVGTVMSRLSRAREHLARLAAGTPGGTPGSSLALGSPGSSPALGTPGSSPASMTAKQGTPRWRPALPGSP